jgi:hypothetical protein
MLNQLWLILPVLALLLFQVAGARANERLTKIGNFAQKKDVLNSRPHIWILAENGKVNVRVGGSESFAMSSCPDAWLLQGILISPAYAFNERHGIKIRFTSYQLQPRLEPDIHVYHDGKYWKVSRGFLKPILDSTDETKLAEIKDQVLWFGDQRLGKLPEQSTPGKWYPSPLDLEVVLADDFHGDMIMDLHDHCQGTLSNWQGKELQLRLNDHASITTGALNLSHFRILANKLSKVDVGSVTCESLDAAAQKESVVSIKAGHIAKASTDEIFGGKVTILAEVDKPDGQSTGLTNTQKIIKKQTPQGTILEFPKYGNFELK